MISRTLLGAALALVPFGAAFAAPPTITDTVVDPVAWSGVRHLCLVSEATPVADRRFSLDRPCGVGAASRAIDRRSANRESLSAEEPMRIKTPAAPRAAGAAPGVRA